LIDESADQVMRERRRSGAHTLPWTLSLRERLFLLIAVKNNAEIAAIFPWGRFYFRGQDDDRQL